MISIKRARNFSKGYSLIELLIAISIIGILASVITVSYNTYQRRARNIVRINAAEQIRTALKSVVFQNDSLGLTSSYRYCASDNLPDLNNDGVKDCGEQGSFKKGMYDATLIGKLKKQSSVLPQGEPVKAYATNHYYGPTFEYYPGWKLGNEYKPYMLHYWLEGKAQKCEVGQSIIFNYDDSQPYASAPPYPDREILKSTNPYSYTDDLVTYCFVIW